MLGKLALRNAKRSLHDYFVYLLTMIIITTMMFAFDSMIFSEDIRTISREAGMMGMMIGLMTFFIVLIIVWLVHYMVKFMAEKRSREFATYLLLGFRKKQVARLFFRENVLMGAAAFVIGLLPGMVLQQMMTSAIYAMIQSDYKIKIDFSLASLAMTAGIYAGSYLLALFRNQRRFKKMTIQGMMNMERQNEEIKGGNKSGRQWMFWAALIFIGVFEWMMVTERFNEWNVYLMILGLVISVYFLYMGLAAFLVGHIRRKGKHVRKGGNVFVYRQLSAKIRTMQFTLGTLTVLFMVALVGASWALMLGQYQNTQGDEKFPFDVAAYRSEADYDFRQEIELVEKEAAIDTEHTYRIYQNGTDDWNTFLGENYAGADTGAYFRYDTYMKVSDYNILRGMLGYGPVEMKENEYLVQVKERLTETLKPMTEKSISLGGKEYHFGGTETIFFEQNGHNGADYVLVVPDEAIKSMTPYYSAYMAMLKGDAPEGLSTKILNLWGFDSLWDATEVMLDGDFGYGSDNIYSTSSPLFVRDEEIPEMKFLLTALIFPLFYIGMVFFLVAVTVLSVQQLSDSSKYRKRYHILQKLGMKKKELNKVILKELALYYVFPFAGAVLLSGGIIGYISILFVTYSGVIAPAWKFFALALALFGGIYVIYFGATYVGFKRNAYEGDRSLE
ncbi:MAG: ABC transporter permease [Eubacteriales bacterium]|nr:ABC transporter permease [Eubacteriales bacterium]